MNKFSHCLHHGFLFLFIFLIPLIGFTQNAEIPNNISNFATQNSSPDWIKIKSDVSLGAEDFISLLKENNSNIPGNSEFRLKNSTKNQIGKTRHIYQEYWNNIPVQDHVWMIHEDNGEIFLAQGKFFAPPNRQGNQPRLNRDQAFARALNAAKGSLYAWQVPEMENQIKLATGNPDATYYPPGQMVWVADEDKGHLVLAFKFEIYTIEPLSKKRYFISANNGRLIKTVNFLNDGCFASDHTGHAHEKVHLTPENILADSSGTGVANYVNANSGVVPITADYNGTDFTLQTSGLGPNGTQVIQTMNANHQANFSNVTHFHDADNNWDTLPTAVGAHWAVEKTYHYFDTTFQRSGIDSLGGDILCVVHYGQNYFNAHWDGIRMYFGDADGAIYGALTSMDIVAHEYMHGVTQNNGNGDFGLAYQNESGALNESFSDIFGAVIEFLYHPDGGDWLIGEDFDLVNHQGFRSMENPETMGHPEAYLDNNWYSGTGDNGGVHINSSVQNYWFYLLANGGSGTNDFGFNYNISPIGMHKAAAISYYNLMHFLPLHATYEQAMEGSIMAAELLYPTDPNIKATVEAAWCAVGLGTGCGPTITIEAPTQDEVLVAGQNYDVQWSSYLLAPTAQLKIEYTTDTDANPFWNFIELNVDNDGSYTWAVPSNYSDTVRLRISDQTNSSLKDISDTFKIVACIAENSFSAPASAGTNELVQFTSNTVGDSYEWEINGQIVGSTQHLSYTFTEGGIYDVTYTVTSIAGNCSNEESKSIYILGDNSSGFTIKVADAQAGVASSQEILKTRDGGYIFVSQFTNIVFKFDALGALVWKSNGFPGTTFGNYRIAATEKPDSNIVIVMGRSPSNGSSPDDNLMIVELDGQTGTILNNLGKQLGVTGRLFPHQVIATDNSLIIGGEFESNFERDVFLIEINSSNYSIINQTWIGDDSIQDYYGELIPTAEGGYLFGWIQPGVPTDHEYFGIIKMDENFQTIWREGLNSNTLRPGSRSRMRLVEAIDCEGYIILADADEYANSALIKINTLGNVQWSKKYNHPGYYNGQLIAFQDMVYDGKDGVTLLGIVGSKLNSLNYPTEVEYQLLNVGFDGQMNWKRKVTDLDVVIPWDPDYNLYVTKLALAADGGYIAAIPGENGAETHLIKTDELGVDGCVMANTNINEESIIVNPGLINSDLANDPVASLIADYTFNIAIPPTPVSSPKCGNIAGSPVIAEYCAKSFGLLVKSVPEIINLSRGATSYNWKIDGTPVTFPLPAFDTAGVFQVTLEANNGADVSSVSYQFNIVDSVGCQLPCDLAVDGSPYTLPSSCPDSEDGEIVSAAISPIGRSFTYHLFDVDSNFITSQNGGHFTGLASGTYQVVVVSTNDESCTLDIGDFILLPKVDITPPQAICQTDAVDVAFVHSAVGLPWDHPNYINELNSALGTAWHEMTFEGVNASKLFSDSYNYVYLEGTDNNADELETFLNTNQSIIENWVAAGNALFLNASPREGDGMSFGFGGVELVRGSFDSAFAVTPAVALPNGPSPSIDTIFRGPSTPITDIFGGGPYAGGKVVCPPGMDTIRVLQDQNGLDLLVQAVWGNGIVLFGGLNLSGFHQPTAEAINLKVNIHSYLKDLPNATLNTPLPLYLDANKSYTLGVGEIDLGSLDDCEIMSVTLDTSEFNCQNIGLQSVVLTAIDVANNMATCTSQVQIIDTSQTILFDTICAGDTHVFVNTNLTEAGQYRDTIQNALLCDSILVLNLTVLDTSYTPSAATICAGDTYEFNGQNLTTAGVYYHTLQNINQCDSILMLSLTVLDTSLTQLNASICEGDTYDFNGQNLTIAGVYFHTLQNTNQCDSTIMLSLTVFDTSLTQLNASICEGDTYDFNGQKLTLSGEYRDTFLNEHSCDSIIVLNLSVIDTFLTAISANICQGDNYPFNGQNLTVAGEYRDTLQSANQCDSILVLDLTVHDTSQTVLFTNICEGDSYNFNGQILTTEGVYYDVLQNANQCDSTLVLNVSVLDTSYTQLIASICEGDTYDFNGQNLSSAGIYYHVLQNANFCDSTLELTLTVLDTSATQLSASICEGDTYDFNGQGLTVTGVYKDTLQNSNQCDSFIILNLSVVDTFFTSLTISICQGDDYLFNGQNLTLSGEYKDTLPSANLCDSIIVLNLTVFDTAHTELIANICQGDTYDFNGNSLNSAGIYRDTLSNVNQCDSFIVLNLSILDTSFTQLSAAICQGETYDFNGQNLTAAGLYYDYLQNTNLCDSTVILTLTVLDTSATELSASICEGDTYDFNGQSLTATGVYFNHLQNTNLCDSTVRLTLTVLDTSLTQLSASICEGDIYDFNGQSLSVGGEYRDTLQNSNQCDSILILNLTVFDTSRTQLSANICAGDTYEFNGLSLTIAGQYRDTLLNYNQCDSFLVLNLAVLDTSYTSLSANICAGDTYEFNGQSLSIAGEYRDTLLNANQCDSILVLNLGVLDTNLTQISTSICEGETYEFDGQSLSVAGEYRDTLLNANQCDSILVLNLAVLDTNLTQISANICEGDTYNFNGQNLAIAGEYRDTVLNTNQCDSILVLNLSVLDTSLTQISASICEGDIYEFNGQNLSIASEYRDTLLNANQCDSVLVLNLAVLDTSQTQISASICEGDTFEFDGLFLSIAGEYRDTLLNANQCDSIIVLNLAVLDTNLTQISANICEGDTYEFDGQSLSIAGEYRDTLLNTNHCDSMVVLNLSVNDTNLTQISANICEGDTYEFDGQNLSIAGEYRDTVLNANQCDSILVLNLSVLDTSLTQISASICEGDIYEFNGQNLSIAGEYRDTLLNANQCDSVLVLNLAVLDTSQTQISASICEGDTFEFDGLFLSIAGEYRDTLQNANQCDSIIVLNLAVLDTNLTQISAIICEGDTYEFDGQNLSITGEYRDTLLNANQCDSIVVLSLSVHDTNLTQISANICEGDTYEFDGQNLSIAGEYRDTLLNANQCDSILVLNLSVLDTSLTQISASICEGDIYEFNGQNLSIAGEYRDTLLNANQCDSVLVLNLAVLENDTTRLFVSICVGESYEFNGQFLTTSDRYRDTLQNAKQCDSLILLTLMVFDTAYTQLSSTICEGEVYDFNGQNLTTTGEYRDTLQNTYQCDSVIVLNLSVLDTSFTEVNASICEGETYEFNAQSLTTSGEYRDTLHNANQCDSLIVLNLTVSNPSTTELSLSICQGDSYFFDNQFLTTPGQYMDTLINAAACDSIISLSLSVVDCNNCTDGDLELNDSPILKGHYRATGTIRSGGVLDVDTITYRAQECIILKDGFTALPGTNFLAVIDPNACGVESTNESLNEPIDLPSTQRTTIQTTNLTGNELLVQPNPFYQDTNIKFSLGTPQKVHLALYSVEGRLLQVLQNGYLKAGNYSEKLEAGWRDSGMYIIVLKTEQEVLTKKIIRLE